MSDHWVHWIRIISNKWSFYLVFSFSTDAQAYFVNTHTQVTTERTNGIRKQISSIRQQYVSRMWFFKNRISCSSVRQCSNDLVFFFIFWLYPRPVFSMEAYEFHWMDAHAICMRLIAFYYQQTKMLEFDLIPRFSDFVSEKKKNFPGMWQETVKH